MAAACGAVAAREVAVVDTAAVAVKTAAAVERWQGSRSAIAMEDCDGEG